MYFKVIFVWEAHGNYSNAQRMASVVFVVSIIGIIMPGVLQSLEEYMIKLVVNQHPPQLHYPTQMLNLHKNNDCDFPLQHTRL